MHQREYTIDLQLINNNKKKKKKKSVFTYIYKIENCLVVVGLNL
jgi:hypothetical protein